MVFGAVLLVGICIGYVYGLRKKNQKNTQMCIGDQNIQAKGDVK